MALCLLFTWMTGENKHCDYYLTKPPMRKQRSDIQYVHLEVFFHVKKNLFFSHVSINPLTFIFVLFFSSYHTA